MAPFELSEQVISEVVFAMEDQSRDWWFDTEKRSLVAAEEIGDAAPEAGAVPEPRYVPVPVWEPADGFQLMERFVEGVRNPELRQRLEEALRSRRGVFRRFKDILREHPAFERRWHSFKDQEMRSVVFAWYNDLRESWGLDPVEVPEEPPEELLETDVQVRRPGEQDLAPLEEMRYAVREELISSYPELMVFLGGEFHHSQAPAPLGEEGGVHVLVAEAAGGELCGYVSGAEASRAREPRSRPEAVQAEFVLREIYVRPEFRGLGIGRMLLERFIGAREAAEQAPSRREDGGPLVELLGTAVFLAPLLGDDFETVALFLRPRRD